MQVPTKRYYYICGGAAREVFLSTQIWQGRNIFCGQKTDFPVLPDAKYLVALLRSLQNLHNVHKFEGCK